MIALKAPPPGLYVVPCRCATGLSGALRSAEAPPQRAQPYRETCPNQPASPPDNCFSVRLSRAQQFVWAQDSTLDSSRASLATTCFPGSSAHTYIHGAPCTWMVPALCHERVVGHRRQKKMEFGRPPAQSLRWNQRGATFTPFATEAATALAVDCCCEGRLVGSRSQMCPM